MHVASGLFSWSMAAGLLAFSSRQFAPTINHGPLSASHILFYKIIKHDSCEIYFPRVTSPVARVYLGVCPDMEPVGR